MVIEVLSGVLIGDSYLKTLRPYVVEAWMLQIVRLLLEEIPFRILNAEDLQQWEKFFKRWFGITREW